MERDWTIADLRLLDPLDSTQSPSTDILAVYDRINNFDLEIRIDLLDIPITPDYDLRLELSAPTGVLTIFLPATGPVVVTPSQSGIQARVVRDPWLDTVTVRLNRLAMPQPFSLQVASFVKGSSTVADETAPVRSDAEPPLNRAPLLLAFWDTFPVSTPAQALRRWDGAHSGPRGERHGLSQVIEGAATYHLPLVLLDLKTPASLAALNYMGVLAQVRTLTNQGLLILPDVAYAEPSQASLDFSRKSAAGFALPGSQFAYSPAAVLQARYSAQFLALDDSEHLSLSGITRLIPMPAPADSQATLDGPSLDVRRQLILAAVSGDGSRLVVLGGDLPLSTWGNHDMAAPTFAWLAAHPWIHPLGGADLQTFPIGSHAHLPPAAGATAPVNGLSSAVLNELNKAPDNPISASAWQSWFMLTSPTADEPLSQLRLQYLGEVDELLAASRWLRAPASQVDCQHDLNGDGQPECVLSSGNFLAILDPRGSRLTDLFYLDGTGPHQLVGPSSQFAVGLSDPSEWHLGLGEAADPQVIPGAFSEGSERWNAATQVGPGVVTFTSPDGLRQKTYTLEANGIQVTYQGFGSVDTRVPLVVDPMLYEFSPVHYHFVSTPGTWTWGLRHDIQIELRSSATLSGESFIDSRSFLPGPENPDQAYPDGHYLPFPLSVVRVQSSTDFSLRITVVN